MAPIAVIDVDLTDLNRLLDSPVTAERLEDEGSMLGVLFEQTDDGLEVEVEPNRPDLLSAEGLARALRGFLGQETGFVEYDVADGMVTVQTEEPVDAVRPHIACCRVTGLDLDQQALDSLIQLQEKLTETYGRNRAKVAIGLHDFGAVAPPITYTAVDPDTHAFEPLGRDQEMTPAAILEDHDKGQEYGWILADADRYPLIVDDAGTVLSMPPVINGTATEMTADTTDCFLDVTGTDRDAVRTALRIVAAAMTERGGTIEAVTVDGEPMPDMTGTELRVDPGYVQDVSGLDDLSPAGMADELAAMRYRADATDDGLAVTVPAYRADVMHAYDVIEDVTIAYGYDDINPELPDIATVGGETPERVFVDRLRDVMVGAGAQELMTFILSNRDKLFGRMARDEQDVVAMANPLTEDYTVVRHELLPSLLEVLGRNTHNRSPQTVFEVGRCAVPDKDADTGARDVRRLAYATCHGDAGFDAARGVLQSLATVLDADLAVAAADHPSFADGRCGTATVGGREAGVVGELSETVLANWGVDDPVAAFELDVAALRAAADH